jgi:hypothetical protein
MRPSRSTFLVLMAFVAAALAAAVTGTAGTPAPPAAAPVNTTPPSISGTAMVGATLTTSDGTWSNSPTSFAYQWLRCNGGGNKCASIVGATQKTYALVTADALHTIRARVTATNSAGAAAADSAQTSQVVPASSTAAPKNTALPTTSGTARVGQTLTAGDGNWSGNPASFSYAWLLCDADKTSTCTTVIGATAKTYVLHAADLGLRVRVRVTARNSKGSATATSAPTAIVAPVTRITNHRPTLVIISARFLGAAVYARFHICDDSLKNLTIIQTDSRSGVASYTRRFTTLVPPRPCGVYTRHWTPVARFRGSGRYTLTLRARDKSGLTSLPARRSFNHG